MGKSKKPSSPPSIPKLTDSMPEVVEARSTKKRKNKEVAAKVESESESETSSSESESEDEVAVVPEPAPTKKHKKNAKSAEDPNKPAGSRPTKWYIEGDTGYTCVYPKEHLYVCHYHTGLLIRKYKPMVDDDGAGREKDGKQLLRKAQECWVIKEALPALILDLEKNLEAYKTAN